MIEFASCDGCGLCIAACSTEALRPQARFDTGLTQFALKTGRNPVSKRACGRN
ncbi:4Fe-4S binding protein, partial [Escherichia sp. SS-MK2]